MRRSRLWCALTMAIPTAASAQSSQATNDSIAVVLARVIGAALDSEYLIGLRHGHGPMSLIIEAPGFTHNTAAMLETTLVRSARSHLLGVLLSYWGQILHDANCRIWIMMELIPTFQIRPCMMHVARFASCKI